METKSLKTKNEFEIILETRALIQSALESLHKLEQEMVYKVSKKKNLELYERSVDCDCSYLIEEIRQHSNNVEAQKLDFVSKIQEAKRFSIDNILKL